MSTKDLPGRTTPAGNTATQPRRAAGAGASAASTAKKTTTARTHRQLFRDAEEHIPDLDAALEFLRKRTLVPEGDEAVSDASLISGLLHLGLTAPAADLARKSLIAFAHLAKAIVYKKLHGNLVTTVAERVEAQLTLRLDAHAEKVEQEVATGTDGMDEARKKMMECTAQLREACQRLEGATAALSDARDELQAERGQMSVAGASPPQTSTLTLDTAPMRTRRAVDLSDLLQRQVLVRGVAVEDPEGNKLGDKEVLEKARQALDIMAGEGLTPPKDTSIDSAKVQRHGDVVFTATSRDLAKWLLNPNVNRSFTRKMGASAKIVERTYQLVAECVPVGFNPGNAQALREIERVHGLTEGAIVTAEWIRAIEKRYPGQRTAYLQLTFNSVEQANRALRGLTIAGRRVIVRRDIKEPLRCLNCQRYDGHLARECPSPHPVCAVCAGHHATGQCAIKDSAYYRCANCEEGGHAAWDRSCPTHRRKVRDFAARRADSGFRFFVTSDPTTWITDEEALSRAPPPPSLWDHIAHSFPPDTDVRGPRQANIDSFFGAPPRDPPPATY